jgi:hypothetical protein
MEYVPGALWYTATLDPAAFSYIDLAGTTQFRLRFAQDDNDNNSQDYMKFFSGDAASTDQPVLTIDYFSNPSGVPSVIGIFRADADSTAASSVRFSVAFSDPVTGVDATDFSLATTGGINGAAIMSVSGSGDTYTVTAKTGSGNGTIRLDVRDDDSIKDGDNRSLGGNGIGNGDFSSGETYTIKKPNVNVYIGPDLQGQYFLAQNESTRQSYANTNNGPVKIVNTDANPMIAAERVIYKVNNVPTNLTEMMAVPNSQLDNTYWLPWYNNVDLDTQLRFGNVSGSTAHVNVLIGGVEMAGSPFTLAPGASTRQSFASINDGPVKIVSDQNIVAAERVIYKVNGVPTSFSEMMALPNRQLNSTYWLPWYNNVDLDTQLRFGNVSNIPASVHVYIGTDEMTGSPFTLQPGESTRQSFVGINNGPVKIQSDQGVPIVVTERIIYEVNGVNTSFTEMMGLPDGQLNTTYWLPWYNNLDLDTQLRFGNVSRTTADVHVYVGGVEMAGSPFTVATGQSKRVSFAVNDGPVKIVSDHGVPIVADERVIYRVNGIPASFSEMTALPNNQLDTTYWLPWYNNVDLDTQLRFGVP